MGGALWLSRACLLVAVATTLAVMRIKEHQHFDCPLAPHLSPCTCTERQRGLDISCSEVGQLQLREVIDVIELTRQTVWFLRITNSNLKHFPENLLRGIDIRNLVVLQCNVTDFDPNAFLLEAKHMESLDLARNSLTIVPTKALSALSTLAVLNLDFNFIEVLEPHSFKGLVSLLWLSLYGNRIRTIDSRAFLGTEASLTRLNLGGNKLQEVPCYPLHKLNCLRGLRLHDNNITEVLLEFLPPSLSDLDLSGNSVETIGASAFSVLPHISALDLEDNKIKTLDTDVFRGVEDSLEWLKLGGNAMITIPSLAFRNLTRLRQLDLRCNLITSVDGKAFDQFGKTLKFIFLQKNKIRTIHGQALGTLQSAEWLYLHSNKLTQLSIETFKPVIANLQVLDLHDNPFDCDCGVLWFRDWLHDQGANVANLPKETRCKTPRELALVPIVKLTNNSFSCSSADVTQRLTNWILILTLWMTSRVLRR